MEICYDNVAIKFAIKREVLICIVVVTLGTLMCSHVVSNTKCSCN